MGEKEGKVRVVVRVRPLIDEELQEYKQASTIVVQPHADGRRLTLVSDTSFNREFEFDCVAHYLHNTQESFYQLVGEPLISSIFSGVNATIIAYGQVLQRRYIGTPRPALGKRTRCSETRQPSTHSTRKP